MDIQSVEEANNLLSNGILVQTAKGLVCLSLNDALSSGLNLSVEDLQNLATELLLQQQTKKSSTSTTVKEKPLISVQTVQAINSSFVSSDGLGDSDGFTSESSDIHQLPSTSTCSSSSAAATPVPLPMQKQEAPHHKYVSLTLAQNDVIELTTDVESFMSSTVSDSDASSVVAVKTTVDVGCAPEDSKAPPAKKRGGWPKGRKRKPELLHLPPKAPSTGYNLYLNEQRLLFKNSSLPFHEITKLIGNKWSSLSLQEKKPYLDRAEEEKRRYKEELRAYRQSSAYQLYQANKRRNRSKYSVLSESDMDATDDLDEEDNEELYCRTCDQYFHNLHNKREHLQGRQHMQMLAGAIHSDSFGVPLEEALAASACDSKKPASSDVTECMNQLIAAISKREIDVKSLQRAIKEKNANHTALYQQLTALKEREAKLKKDLTALKEVERGMEQQVISLWQVPSWFVINDGTNAD